MIEWFLFGIAAVAAPLLIAQCIGAMGDADGADGDIWKSLGSNDHD